MSYFFVYFHWIQVSKNNQGHGNIVLSFDEGGFSPSKAISVIANSFPEAENVIIVNWKEISEKSFEEWNFVFRKNK